MPTVLKPIKKKPMTKLIGVRVPLPTFNFLSLYTVAEGLTKSEMLKLLIDEWLEKSTTVDKDFLKAITNRVVVSWKDKHKNQPRASQAEYIKSVRKDLFYKGLTMVQIDKVISNAEKIWKEPE